MTATVTEVDTDTTRKLTRIARRAVKATEERDAAIVDAYEAGAGLREIGRAVGLSHPGVRNIILRRRGTLDVESATRVPSTDPNP